MALRGKNQIDILAHVHVHTSTQLNLHWCLVTLHTLTLDSRFKGFESLFVNHGKLDPAANATVLISKCYTLLYDNGLKPF